MSNSQKPVVDKPEISTQDDDDEPDAWDKRISDTGCSAENTRLNDCFFDKKDWRLCKAEMEAFKACWKVKGNTDRTESRDGRQ